MASTAGLRQFIENKMEPLSRTGFCQPTYNLTDYYETHLLLQAAGHDTTEFRDAIRQILESITQLKSARDAAIAKSKQQGCCFTIIE